VISNTFLQATRLGILRISSLQKGLVYDLRVVCEKCKNPAIIKWNERLLLCGEFQSHGTQLIFSWINDTRYPFYSVEDHLGIATKVHKLQTELYGIDPRLLAISEDKFLVIYSLYGKHVRNGGIVLAGYEKNKTNNSTMEFYLTPRKMYLEGDKDSKQKNWMPFLYNNTPHFIQRINPMHVVKILYHDETGQCVAGSVSLQPKLAVHWEYGEIRGGTNAVLLEDIGEYLGLFHSMGNFAMESKSTYFFGAFTFSAEPPFRLLRLSHTPILDKDSKNSNLLYDGPWFRVMGLPINFVNYPTGLFVEQAAGIVHISFGHNDITGYRGKINLQELLDSMLPVS